MASPSKMPQLTTPVSLQKSGHINLSSNENAEWNDDVVDTNNKKKEDDKNSLKKEVDIDEINDRPMNNDLSIDINLPTNSDHGDKSAEMAVSSHSSNQNNDQRDLKIDQRDPNSEQRDANDVITENSQSLGDSLQYNDKLGGDPAAAAKGQHDPHVASSSPSCQVTLTSTLAILLSTIMFHSV